MEPQQGQHCPHFLIPENILQCVWVEPGALQGHLYHLCSCEKNVWTSNRKLKQDTPVFDSYSVISGHARSTGSGSISEKCCLKAMARFCPDPLAEDAICHRRWCLWIWKAPEQLVTRCRRPCPDTALQPLWAMPAQCNAGHGQEGKKVAFWDGKLWREDAACLF